MSEPRSPSPRRPARMPSPRPAARCALGLGRIGKTNTLPDRPEIRGMIARVPHLITVETAANPEEGDASS